MKTSEMLMIGSLLLKAKAAVVFELDPFGRGPSGCALGMIAMGNGYSGNPFEETLSDFIPPWINDNCTWMPCCCVHEHGLPPLNASRVGSIIAHLFDHHVFGRGDWTLEKIADWLRSIEPAEIPSVAARMIGEPEPETVVVEISAEAEPELALVGT